MGERIHHGSMDDLEAQEINLAMMTHNGTDTGNLVLQTEGGNLVAVASITYDHSQVGALLNPNAGLDVANELLYSDLDESQQKLLADMEDWRANDEIDFA